MIPEPMGLNAAVAGLGAFKHMAPLAPLHINVDPIDVMSPMAIDSPMDDEVCSRSSDEFGVDPYYEDIYHYLRSQEKRARPTVNYMSRQTDVTTSMRNILVDWLVEVGSAINNYCKTGNFRKGVFFGIFENIPKITHFRNFSENLSNHCIGFTEQQPCTRTMSCSDSMTCFR